MSKRQLSILIASLFVAAPALAQSKDPFLSTGQVEAGGIWSQTNSTNDASKFNEYQDLSNGMLTNIGVTGRNASSWLNAYGENFGRDDMYVNLRGGMYDVFKAQAYTNWIPHNFLFNGLTPFAGSGSSTLTATFPQPNSGTWNSVNLGYDRKNSGGYFEWQRESPWYFRVDGNQVQFDGTKPGGWANGTSPGQGFVDTAIPVQWTTNNAAFEGGYTTRTMTFTVSYLASNFNNDNQSMKWTNPYFTNGTDTSYLAPSNDYQRFALNGVIRSLAWNSTLSARYTWDKTKDDVGVASTALSGITNGVPVFTNLQPNTSTFNGNQQRQTFTLGWAATPVAGLDTNMYYNWQKMKNDSTEVIFCPSNASTCDTTFDNEERLWHYEKNNFGVDAYWRINKGNRVGAGYDWFNIKQNRTDFDNNTTNTFWVEWKNTSFDALTFRLKYWYLQRRGDYLLSEEGVDANDPLYLERFIRFYDLADFNQNRVKAWVDWAPSDNTSVTLEYIYKKNDYKETQLGLVDNTRNEIAANLTYGTPNSWRVTLFGDYETIKDNSDHRYISTQPCNAATGPNCFDPNKAPVYTLNSTGTAVSGGAYNWGTNIKNTNWMVGVGLDVPVNDSLMLTGSLLYEQLDGSSEMTSQNNYGNPLPLPTYPNIKTTALNLKANYKASKNWSVTLGYAYQKYDYSDDAFSGYLYSLPSLNATTGVNTETQRSYLNGWNAFQSYNANIVYLTLRFTWDPPVLAASGKK